MLKRKIDQEFLGFLQGPTKEALLVTGARQVGKTFSVRQFAHRHFQDFVEINFIEHPEAKALFDSVHGTKDFFNRFSAYVGRSLTKGKTLVFFDDSRYVLDDVSSSRALAEHLAERVARSESKTLLVLADRRVHGGDLMDLAAVAKRGGATKVLFAQKRVEASDE